MAEDLGFGHAQDLPGLLLAHGYALNAAPVDLGKIAGVVDYEREDNRQKSVELHTQPHQTRPVEHQDYLKHKRRSADYPDENLEYPLYRGYLRH